MNKREFIIGFLSCGAIAALPEVQAISPVESITIPSADAVTAFLAQLNRKYNAHFLGDTWNKREEYEALSDEDLEARFVEKWNSEVAYNSPDRVYRPLDIHAGDDATSLISREIQFL